MKNIYSVTVLINGDVWGSWTLDQKLSFSDRNALRKLMIDTSNDSQQFTVQFSDNLECDNFDGLMSGIKESLSNENFID